MLFKRGLDIQLILQEIALLKKRMDELEKLINPDLAEHLKEEADKERLFNEGISNILSYDLNNRGRRSQDGDK